MTNDLEARSQSHGEPIKTPSTSRVQSRVDPNLIAIIATRGEVIALQDEVLKADLVGKDVIHCIYTDTFPSSAYLENPDYTRILPQRAYYTGNLRHQDIVNRTVKLERIKETLEQLGIPEVIKVDSPMGY